MYGRHLRACNQQSRDDPARYIAAIDVEINPPHTIIRIDGGMITASTADTAVMAMENERS